MNRETTYTLIIDRYDNPVRQYWPVHLTKYDFRHVMNLVRQDKQIAAWKIRRDTDSVILAWSRNDGVSS